MKDDRIPDEALVQELAKMRGRISELEETVAECKRTEESLRQSETRYRSLFETSHDSIFIVDRETGVFIAANPAAVRLYGYSEGEFQRMGYTDVSAEPEKTESAVRSYVRIVPFRLHKRKDGTVFPVEIAGGYFVDNGRVMHTAFIRDISERRKQEKELKTYHDNLEDMVKVRTEELTSAYELLKQENEVRKAGEAELERRRQEFEEMNAALRVILKQREEDKTAIEMNVMTNHRVSILPYIEMLEKTGLNADQMQFLELIKSNLGDITSTFNRKISTENIGLSPNEVKVAALVKGGKTSKEIAGLLNVSLNTVNTYRRKIRTKTGLINEDANLRTYLLSLE